MVDWFALSFPEGSPLPEWSETTPISPTDVADSFDFNDGDMGPPRDGEGVSKPLLETLVRVFELLPDLAVMLDFDEKLDGGVFGLRNSLGCFRKFSPVLRPLRSFSEEVGESTESATVASEALDIPENDRGGARDVGVDALRKTAKR